MSPERLQKVWSQIESSQAVDPIEWLRAQAEKGDADAQCLLGHYLYFGNKIDGIDIVEDKAEAVEWWKKASALGQASAQYSLAVCYDEGEVVEQDKAKAVELFLKAAEQGNAKAQSNLGSCYWLGEGVREDKTKAVEWYRKAAENGEAKAQYNLGHWLFFGIGMEENKAEAIKWWQQSAEQGNADAQFSLGDCYSTGEGIDEDIHKTIELFHKAAEQDHPVALYNLGVLYYHGDDVEEDKAKAFEFWRRSAEQGYPAAFTRLGNCYRDGDGTDVNIERARQCWQTAAEGGDSEAQFAFGVDCFLGDGVEQNKTLAVEFWQQAAEQGNADAQYFLGMCHYWGEGADKNSEEAVKWLQEAAAQDYDYAIRALGISIPNSASKPDNSLMTLTVPYGAIENVIFSPDGNYILASRSTGDIDLWDIRNADVPKNRFDRSASSEQHWRTANGLWFAQDGKSFYTGAEDGDVFQWETDTSKLLNRYECASVFLAASPTVGIHCIALSQDEKWLAASGNLSNPEEIMGIALWNLQKKTLCGSDAIGEEDHPDSILATSVAFAPNNQTLLATGKDQVRLYALGKKGIIGKYTVLGFGFEDLTYCGSFSPSGRWIMATSDDKTVRVWDTVEQRVCKILVHPDKVRQAVFSPDERLILTGCHDGIARLWNFETGEEFCRFEGHTGPIEYGVAFSSKGALIATGSYDKTVKIWNVPKG